MLFGVIILHGENYQIMTSNEFGEKTIHMYKKTRVQRKQGRGGQSKNRIERLRQESVHNYIKMATEHAMTVFIKEGHPIISSLLICGSGMKKEMIQEYLTIPIPYYIQSIDVGDDITPYLLNMIKKQTGIDEQKEIEMLSNLIIQQPDYLVFGVSYIIDELNQNSIERIYINEENEKIYKTALKLDNFKTTIIKSNWLNQYGGIIGKRYIPCILN